MLELALRESIRLRHGRIGRGHVLFGLVTEGEGLAARIWWRRVFSLDEISGLVRLALGKAA